MSDDDIYEDLAKDKAPLSERRGHWWISYVTYVRPTRHEPTCLKAEDMLIRGTSVRVHPIEWIRRMQLNGAHDNGARYELLTWREMTEEEYVASSELESW